jgi:Arc/MetJ-type ribon-helix-helix transcriptional regulator
LERGKKEYVPVKLPRDLIDEMDQLVGTFGFRSRAEIAKEAIRRLLTALHGVKEAEQ